MTIWRLLLYFGSGPAPAPPVAPALQRLRFIREHLGSAGIVDEDLASADIIHEDLA